MTDDDTSGLKGVPAEQTTSTSMLAESQVSLGIYLTYLSFHLLFTLKSVCSLCMCWACCWRSVETRIVALVTTDAYTQSSVNSAEASESDRSPGAPERAEAAVPGVVPTGSDQPTDGTMTNGRSVSEPNRDHAVQAQQEGKHILLFLHCSFFY